MISVKKRFVPLLMGVLMVILAACASSPIQTPMPGNQQTTVVGSPSPSTEVPTSTAGIPVTGAYLANTEWRLVSFGEQGAETPVLDNTEPTLEFEETGQAGGSGGCNTFSTQYAVQDSTITFEPIFSTEIACTAEGVMEQEQRYFQTLQSANRFEQIDDRLVIHSENGSVLNFASVDSSATPTPVSSLLCSKVGEGSTPGWILCRSQGYRFEVQYPPDAEMIDHTSMSARINLPFPPNVNLTEKYLTMTATEDVAVCSSPLAEGRPAGSFSREPVQINGLEFIKETGQEAATGSVYNWEAYSISREDNCISLSFVLRSFRPALAATPPTEYDFEEESQIFTEIVSRFEWLETPTEPTSTPLAAERIEFAPGATSATVTGQLQASGSDQYVLRALGGQTMSVDLTFTEGAAILAIWGEDGTVLLSDHAEASSFRRALPATQDYFILVKGRPEESTAYTMTVAISALTMEPERIEFTPGATSATVTGQLQASASEQYVLRALEGQTLSVDLAFREGVAILAVWGEDGTVLLSDHAEAYSVQRVLPATQDYHILVKGRPDGSTSYSMTVILPPLQ